MTKEEEDEEDDTGLTGLPWRLRENALIWLLMLWGPDDDDDTNTGLARGLLLIGLRGALPDLVASCLARERRGLLPLLWACSGASRSSSR